MFDIGADDTYKDAGTYCISSDDLSDCYAKTSRLALSDASMYYDGKNKTTLNAFDVNVSMSADDLSIAVPLNAFDIPISADIEYQQISVEYEKTGLTTTISSVLCS